MKKKSGRDTRSDDLQLLSLLVAKRLREEHGSDRVPPTAAYRIVPSKTFFQAGHEVQVDVDLGRGATVVVYDVWWGGDDGAELDSLLSNSADIAEKVADTVRDADGIRAMVAEVGAAARREVAKAIRRGLPYELTGITLPPLQAGQHDEAVVRIEHLALGRSLQLEPFAHHAECAEDVVAAFASLAQDQSHRVGRRAALDRVGATGTIDAVVVAALGASGLELPPVLAALRDTEDWILDLDAPDGKRFTLHWDEGAVRAHIALGDGVSWHQGRLSFGKATRTLRRLPAGSPIRGLLEHPFLDERVTIRGSYGSKGEHLSIACNEAMLNFDADSGRLWAA